MKTQITALLAILGLTAVCATPALGDDLQALTGKWSVQKTNEDGQSYVQHIEIKTNKFTFKITDKDGDTMLYAEGKAKLDKAGPFNTITFSDIQAGQSAGQLDAVDDTFTSIYKLDGDTWMLVMNFDKDHGEQFKPTLDVMRKVSAPKKEGEAPK